MLSRGANASILEAEEWNKLPPDSASAMAEKRSLYSAAPHRMQWFWRFVDANNASKKRPVVDVSMPVNYLDETHQARCFGTQRLGRGFFSLNEITGTYEEVPYTDSHHTSEIVKTGIFLLNVWQIDYLFSRTRNSGTMLSFPHTRFAFNIWIVASMLRVNLAGIIGFGGYFYSYEYLYTHGPWPFRIDDPSPNGWKRAWRDGQECYYSRIAASVWPALAYSFYMHRWKKSAFWFGCTVSLGLLYEYMRRNFLSGNRMYYSVQANKASQLDAGRGSLAPQMRHLVDPDTNHNESVAQFKYFRISSGLMQNTVWENATPENLPLYRPGVKFPNPYYNWRKAPQNYNAQPCRVKNDIWSMPNVLTAGARAGRYE